MSRVHELYPALFAPYTLGGKTLRNRIVHASMTTRMGEKGRVTEHQIQSRNFLAPMPDRR